MEQKPEPRGPAYALRVSDVLAPKAKVTVECFRCKEEKPVDVYQLGARYGAEERLSWIEDRFRCRKCGLKGMASLKIEWTAPK